MYQALPEALADALGRVVADQRKAFERELDRLSAKADAVIADLEAKVARLEVANEMLLVDQRKRVDSELERIREAMALVKDGEPGPCGEPGKDAEVDYGLIMRELRSDLSQMVDELPPPEPGPRGEPGKDADQDAIISLVNEHFLDIEAEQRAMSAVLERKIRTASDTVVADLHARMAELKDGRDGKDGAEGPPGPPGAPGEPGKSVSAEEIVSLVLERLPPPDKGEKGDPGQDGKDAVVDYQLLLAELSPFTKAEVEEQVTKKIAELPDPEPGPQGPPGERGEKGEGGDPGADGKDGRDGAGLAGALIGRNGNLVVTLTDGTTHDLGIVVGKDGMPGRDGADGKDGLSFADFVLEPEYDGERTLRLKWTDAQGREQLREWQLPVVIYREIYRPDAQYQAGDAVSLGGSLWIAKKDTSEKPGNGSDAWRLAVKHGRDGRDGAQGVKGEKGERGPVGPERLITGRGS